MINFLNWKYFNFYDLLSVSELEISILRLNLRRFTDLEYSKSVNFSFQTGNILNKFTDLEYSKSVNLSFQTGNILYKFTDLKYSKSVNLLNNSYVK